MEMSQQFENNLRKTFFIYKKKDRIYIAVMLSTSSLIESKNGPFFNFLIFCHSQKENLSFIKYYNIIHNILRINIYFWLD